MSDLLAPLDADQQSLVDLVAEAFLREDYQWPFFDYIEGMLDLEGRDAWTILETFPELGRWRYSALSWSRSGGAKPSAESEVELTIVGFSHAPALREYVSVFFEVVDFLCVCRLQTGPQPRVARKLTVSSDEFAEHWRASRHLDISPRLTHQLLEHEPPARAGGGGYQSDGSWTRGVARELLEFSGITDITDYVARLEGYLVEPAAPVQPLISSPLTLAAALDYLDIVWRLTHNRQRLFELPSAERTTRLAFDLQTAEEFAAHLSALAEILRSANKRAQVEPAKRGRNRPLARLEADVIKLADTDAGPRISEAVSVLESVVALRDAGQHEAASERAISAHRELGLTYPPVDWYASWQSVSKQTVSALNTLREELEATGL
ncbi:MAG: hypothetical protein WAQ33_06515 [Gaiellaceae bacterium]